ncbi:TrbI/VirB10 family protein [Acidipila sp. EB88]|uniref:TrbI/VirB10 family protein n=1 Tax=Acidipila sp. EB88 TaxID=2305226 RepID=UPI000F5DE426|nr:TrbI/VirB10 family protein [Acidipila sp. EB88]RRA49753.1 hypothetical protein D1Y84_17280 [Acidipila sp. EB88]
MPRTIQVYSTEANAWPGNALRALFHLAALSGLAVVALPQASSAQSVSTPPSPVSAPAEPAPEQSSVVASSITVPAGTKVLLALRSGINTRSAQPGDGVYLASTFPVVVGTRVAIPAGVYVQGVIDRVQRAGRVKGRAEVGMHFTTMIFSNGSVVAVPGALNALPGATDAKVKNGEGDVQQAGSKGKDAGTIARGAETGAGIGAIGGAIGGSPLAGAGYGAVAGGLTGLVYTLFTRGNDVNLEQGETVEMVLQRPLTLTPINLAPGEGPGVEPTAQRSLPKPAHARTLCPPGGLGCP